MQADRAVHGILVLVFMLWCTLFVIFAFASGYLIGNFVRSRKAYDEEEILNEQISKLDSEIRRLRVQLNVALKGHC